MAKQKNQTKKRSAGSSARQSRAKRAGILEKGKRKVEDKPKLSAASLPVEDRDDAIAPVPPLPGFMVVGIGASAGGVEACSQVLAGLQGDGKFAVVIVTHLAPGHESMLPELFAPHTSMPVITGVDGMIVEPGRVYVTPPDVQIEYSHGMLRLLPRPTDRSQYMPVDHFFRSLAEQAQNRAIGIVLSGTASDGAAGLREIKSGGGIAIAQEPKSARFDGMPRAAIATGAVDLILTPKQISEELLRIVTQAMAAPDQEAASKEAVGPTEEQLTRIFMMLRNASGVDFTHYKLPTIRRRLHRRMVLHKMEGIDKYIRYLQQNPPEVTSLYQDILIHVTRFFREPESFEALVQRVFRSMLSEKRGDNPIRIWVPGCATGEEAYSVAIALVEFLGEKNVNIPIQIFATDVSELAVERARAGIYPENISADVSADRLRRFFNKVDGSYRISKQVRDLCIFARQDLTRDPPFSKLDLIVCRNVLIYLGSVLQRKLMSVFHYALKPNGYLMLGSAETIGAYSDLFSIVDKRHRIYVRKSAGGRTDVEFPVSYAPSREELARKIPTEVRSTNSVQTEASRVMINRYAPPGVVVDSELKIVQFRGHTGTFLEPAPGEASLDLLKMAREGLLHGLRSALGEARRTDHAVRREGLVVRRNGDTHEVNLEVIPLTPTNEGKYYLILFETPPKERAGKSKARLKKPVKVRPGKKLNKFQGGERVGQLEQELAASRDYLQSMIQDLEAANEELQSANEEILSANEELQSTNEELDTAKEELQSTNEELNTVNEELQGRNEELSRVNSDLMNLLGSVQIAIAMVNSDLRIRRFTPMAEKVLNLIPTDVGRPIGDIKPNLDCPDLESIIMDAIDTVSIRERECRDHSGRVYLLRVRPYKNLENKIDGAVLALFDMEEAHRRYDTSLGGDGEGSASLMEAVVQAVSRPMVVVDDGMRIVTANDAFARQMGEDLGALRDRSLSAVSEDGEPLRKLREHLDGEKTELDSPIELALAEREGVVKVKTARRVEAAPGSTLIVLEIEQGQRER